MINTNDQRCKESNASNWTDIFYSSYYQAKAVRADDLRLSNGQEFSVQ